MRKKEGEAQALFQGNHPSQSRGYTLYQNHSNYQPYYSASSNQTSTVLPHYTLSNNQTTPVQARLLAQKIKLPPFRLIIPQITNLKIPTTPEEQDPRDLH